MIVSLKPAAGSDPKLVKLQVVTPDIMRISATPSDAFPDRESLTVRSLMNDSVPFTVTASVP